LKVFGWGSNDYIDSCGEWQNSRATPCLWGQEEVFAGNSWILLVLTTLAKLDIFPPNSRRPADGGMDSFTFSKLLGWKDASDVVKYTPPVLTFTVQPV
jgi:hypothetical protein